ncbi:MAG: hypothetical protein NWF08_04145 [Candidatus Bathyarchaeota archaeon]|nr:hypothetical protein [Candidatus Bathyarchaeota archaeon]
MKRGEKPIEAFTFSLISALLILFNSSMLAINPSLIGVQKEITEPLIVLAVVAFIFGIMVLIGAILIYKDTKVRSGPIIVLIFSLMSLIIGGAIAHIHFIVAFLFGIMGAIYGLNWKPKKSVRKRPR